METKQLPPWEVVNHFIKYEPETGFMYWKLSASRYMKKGKMLSSRSEENYRIVKFLGTSYKQHRLAWLLYYKVDPGSMLIDHIDGDKSNNKITNLRLVTHSQNRINTKMRKNNKTGVKGVHFCKRSNRYVASVTFKGKTIYRKYFDCLKSASEARDCVANKVFGDFLP